LVLWLAEWTAWQMSIWHETVTWFGWDAVPGFSEEASAFSPEDLYSNPLAARARLSARRAVGDALQHQR
jgi:hypothetical protein